MSAFRDLIPEGKRACTELEKVTRWSKESWARSVRTLHRAGLFPEIGLEQVYRLSERTGSDPETIAHLLVTEAEKVRAGEEPAPVEHEVTEVCHATGQYVGPLSPHAHDCIRLSGHAPVHQCACGAGW